MIPSNADVEVGYYSPRPRGSFGHRRTNCAIRVSNAQVCHEWLSDRKMKSGKNPLPGRVLTDEDIAHYHRIVIALNETIRLMGEIDEVIEEHGGWPGAFVTEKDAE